MCALTTLISLAVLSLSFTHSLLPLPSLFPSFFLSLSIETPAASVAAKPLLISHSQTSASSSSGRSAEILPKMVFPINEIILLREKPT